MKEEDPSGCRQMKTVCMKGCKKQSRSQVWKGGMNVPGIQAPKRNKTDANKTRGGGGTTSRSRNYISLTRRSQVTKELQKST